MSLLHSSATTRRLLKIATLGLAGLLAGLLTGCSSKTAARLVEPKVDKDWQTSSTYASAVAAAPARGALRSTRDRPCFAASCQERGVPSRDRFSHRRM